MVGSTRHFIGLLGGQHHSQAQHYALAKRSLSITASTALISGITLIGFPVASPACTAACCGSRKLLELHNCLLPAVTLFPKYSTSPSFL